MGYKCNSGPLVPILDKESVHGRSQEKDGMQGCYPGFCHFKDSAARKQEAGSRKGTQLTLCKASV